MRRRKYIEGGVLIFIVVDIERYCRRGQGLVGLSVGYRDKNEKEIEYLVHTKNHDYFLLFISHVVREAHGL